MLPECAVRIYLYAAYWIIKLNIARDPYLAGSCGSQSHSVSEAFTVHIYWQLIGIFLARGFGRKRRGNLYAVRDMVAPRIDVKISGRNLQVDVVSCQESQISAEQVGTH